MTKLTENQKLDLKMLKEFFKNQDLPFELFYFAEFGVTVAMRRTFKGSRTIQIAVSVAAIDEKKLRRKVGQYHALKKLYCSEHLTIPFACDNWMEFAESMAEMVSAYGVFYYTPQ